MKKKIKLTVITILTIMIVGCLGFLVFDFFKEDKQVFVAGNTQNVELTLEETNEKVQITRGHSLFLDKKTKDETAYRVYDIIDDNKVYYIVPLENITEDYSKVVTNTSVKSNMLVNLREDRNQEISETVLTKGEEVKVLSVNMDRDFNEDGTVDGYMIEKEGQTFYLNALYTQPEIEQKEDIYYGTFFDGWYGDGYSKKTYIDELTYLNVDREEFENKPFKKDARAVHVGMSVVYEEQDYLINLCKETGIDTLVLELKSDDGRLIFESDTAKTYLSDPAVVEKTCVSKEEFRNIVEKYKNEGIYLIGRVVAFKDPVFASEYPSEAISYTNGDVFRHNGLEWPSPYSRKAWQYVLSYAKEAVNLGIDEIQFDYVRFPDGMDEDELDLKNRYSETKTQAITHFLYYAREELRNVEAYLSADVFGWNMICGDDQNIGQFIPAIACIVDAISPMPYPDHFGAYSLGIPQPWQEPGLLLERFTESSMEILNTVPQPATFRTWIQGYSCLSWVCEGTSGNPNRDYGPEDMKAQINGIRKAGQTGYIVWSGDGGRRMFDWRKSGFIE